MWHKTSLSIESVVYWYAVHPEACLNFPDKQVPLIKDDHSAQKLCYIYALKPSGLQQNTAEMEHVEIRAVINVSYVTARDQKSFLLIKPVFSILQDIDFLLGRWRVAQRAVESLSLEVFKTCWDRAQSSLDQGQF